MKNKIINMTTLLGIVLAIVFGICFPNIIKELSFLGTIYVNLLKFMIVPIIFSSIVVTIYNSNKKKDRILLKAIIIFILMFLVSFLITAIISFIIMPGKGFKYDAVEWSGKIEKFSFSDIIVNLFPTNIVSMFESGSLFSIIIFAFVSGFIAHKVENGESVIKFMDGVKNIFYKLLEYIMYLTPVGVFALLGTAIADYGDVIFGVGIKYIAMAYLCSLLVLLLVMLIPACIYGKISPIAYIKKMYKIWIMTLTTCSSQATLPTTIKVCNEEFNIPDKVTDITVPLGCTIHMCGGAVSFALLAIFCSQLFSIDISFIKFLLMIVSALLINMAAPGIPNGGIVIGASYLALLNIPLSFIGFYSGIYKLLDMAYTTLNVTGDVTANIIINSKMR